MFDEFSEACRLERGSNVHSRFGLEASSPKIPLQAMVVVRICGNRRPQESGLSNQRQGEWLRSERH